MEFSKDYFFVAQKFPEKIFKKIKKNKGGSQKFFKNEHPKNKKMGKIPKKNNFPKKIFLKNLWWEKRFGIQGGGLFLSYDLF